MLAFYENEAAGSVVGGSVVANTDSLTATDVQDVYNSTILAQLAANKQYDRETQTENWYKYYRNVLENVGYQMSAFDFSKYDSGGSSFTMDKVVLDAIAAIASEGELSVLETTLNAFKELPGDDRSVTLFSDNANSTENGNFQISSASVNEYGFPEMALGASYFKSTQRHTRFLFFEWGSDSVQFYLGVQKITLNTQMYQQVRQQVIDKLGDNAKDFVSNIEI